MSEALRFNDDKPMMSYFMRSFPRMAEAIARVKEMGAIKYNDGNWRLGNKPDDEYWNSMFRHLNYIFNGEVYDPDTGCLHIAHAVWNMCALLELNYPELPARDDEIWAGCAKHWAEEKKKREAKEEKQDEKAVEGWAAECDGDPPDSTWYISPFDDVKFTHTCELEFEWDEAVIDGECPKCGFDFTWLTDHGRECVACGEIFDVPIGPEAPPCQDETKEIKFVILDAPRSEAFDALVAQYFAPMWRP